MTMMSSRQASLAHFLIVAVLTSGCGSRDAATEADKATSNGALDQGQEHVFKAVREASPPARLDEIARLPDTRNPREPNDNASLRATAEPPPKLNRPQALPTQRNPNAPTSMDRPAPLSSDFVERVPGFRPVAQPVVKPAKQPPEIKQQMLAEALQIIRKEGYLQISVGFSVETALNEALRTSHFATDEQGEAEVARLRSEFVDRLRRAVPLGFNARSAPPVGGSPKQPFVSLYVNEPELLWIVEQPEVTYISVPISHKPQVSESVPLISAPAAWGRGGQGHGRTVVVIDLGFQVSHSFLGGRIAGEACFSEPDFLLRDPILGFEISQYDSACSSNLGGMVGSGAAAGCSDGSVFCSHGTRMAGIAIGRTPPGLDAPGNGVAPSASVYLIKVGGLSRKVIRRENNQPIWDQWIRNTPSNSMVVRALDHAYSLRASPMNIVAVNLSMGDGFFSDFCDGGDLAYTSAVAQLRAAGIPVVVASGNGKARGQINFPSCISHATRVGGVTKDDEVWSDGNLSPLVDILAPSGGTPVTRYPLPYGPYIRSSSPPNNFSINSGTSEAAAHVSGAIAVLRSLGRPANVDSLEGELIATGKAIPFSYVASGSAVTKTYRRISLVARSSISAVPTVVAGVLDGAVP